MRHLSVRGNLPSLLFLLQDSRLLLHSLLTDWLQEIMSAAGIPGNFSNHSFHIGNATVASHNGISEHLIQAFGHWFR